MCAWERMRGGGQLHCHHSCAPHAEHTTAPHAEHNTRFRFLAGAGGHSSFAAHTDPSAQARSVSWSHVGSVGSVGVMVVVSPSLLPAVPAGPASSLALDVRLGAHAGRGVRADGPSQLHRAPPPASRTRRAEPTRGTWFAPCACSLQWACCGSCQYPRNGGSGPLGAGSTARSSVDPRARPTESYRGWHFRCTSTRSAT